jgi:hypothetical protein
MKSGRMFCSKPFTWFEVSRGREEGEVFLCCPGWLPRPVGNLQRQSVAEVWNGKAAREIRRSILDGSFTWCDAGLCPHLNELSHPVQPVEEVSDPDLLRAIREELTVLPWGPLEINCSWDRSCNLSCPTCRTAIIVETASRDRILGIQEKIRTEALPAARLLYITGSGDPFGSPFFRRWLHTLKRSDMPRLETLHLHSNGLLWNRPQWEAIPEEVRALVKRAEISVDAATPETYAINRRGGRFQTLLNNLELIRTLRAEGPLEWLGLSMVVQENNFHEMPEFVRLGRRFGVDAVYFGQLADWGTFSAAELRRRSVHLPAHPRHRELRKVLADGIFDDPIVSLGAFTNLR